MRWTIFGDGKYLAAAANPPVLRYEEVHTCIDLNSNGSCVWSAINLAPNKSQLGERQVCNNAKRILISAMNLLMEELSRAQAFRDPLLGSSTTRFRRTYRFAKYTVGS